MTAEDDPIQPGEFGPQGSAWLACRERLMQHPEHLLLPPDWREHWKPRGSAYHMATWIATAAAAGIIGNVAHDVVVEVFNKLGRRQQTFRGPKHSRPGVPEFNDFMDTYAVAAVLARLQQQGLPTPSEQELKVEWIAASGEAWLIQGIVTSKADPTFQAQIELDPWRLQRQGAEVHIRTATEQ